MALIFRQTRLGKDGKVFRIYKLKTINTKLPCTKFLRKYHIDEIPQIINILKGDMKLIGPRPERPIIYKRLPLKFRKRLTVKPGLTGLAQVKLGYIDVNDYKQMRKKLKYDLFYIKHKSFCLDLYILFNTFKRLGNGK
jgi:lipopolysaccharide/colanic/teichoic acid biosynthesis glycosyltransferase